MTGYKTGSLLCMPICNHADEVIGVAQIINKQGSDCCAFTESDVQVRGAAAGSTGVCYNPRTGM